MRVANWNAQKVFQDTKAQVWENGRVLMDSVVADAKRKCPVGAPRAGHRSRNPNAVVTSRPQVFRRGGFQQAKVSFTPETGRNKGKAVSFTAKRWQGRVPGTLRRTIRRVEREGSGTIRAYAGDFKVYYARFVEKGTRKMHASPFLRPAFSVAKANAMRVLKEGK